MKSGVRQDDARFLELLGRWLQGDFTRADERELRLLADADDFRREAWEGLTALPEADHEAQLQALRKRILDQKPGGRMVPFPQWFAAAAAVMLLLAALWFFHPWQQKVDLPIAAVPTQTNPANPEIPAAEQPVADAGKTGKSTQPSETSRAAADQRSASGAAVPSIVSADDVQGESKQELALQEAEAPVVLDKAAAAKPSATQAAPATGAPAGPPAPARDEAAKKAKALPNRQADSTRWFNTDAKPDIAAMKKDADEKTRPEPSGGWEAFSEYLRQNARLTPEARNNNVSGFVRLQFNVNDNGEPYNFQVLKGLGFGCDQEAQRLVKEWEWSPGQMPVTIEVRFVR